MLKIRIEMTGVDIGALQYTCKLCGMLQIVKQDRNTCMWCSQCGIPPLHYMKDNKSFRVNYYFPQ